MSTVGSENVVLGRFPSSESGYVEGEGPLSAFRVTNTHYPPTLYALQRDPVRIHVATAGSREIQTFDREGALVRIVRQRIPLDRLDPSVISDFREAVADSAARDGDVDAQDVLELFDEILFPDSVFPWEELHADRSGNLWARRHTAETAPGSPTWEVFGADGGWLGVVETPSDAGEIVEIGEDYLLTVWTDAFDVSYVRVYGLRRESGG